MQTRRNFVKGLAGAGIAVPFLRENAFGQLFKANLLAGERSPEAIADDETYWSTIQAAFDVDRTMINLNNGGISPAPTHVLAELWREIQFTNSLPVENMWGVLQPRMEGTRRELAEDFGCDPEEMAVCRNASEAMANITFGFDLQKGDEVIVTNQNYGRMIMNWQLRVSRDWIVL